MANNCYGKPFVGGGGDTDVKKCNSIQEPTLRTFGDTHPRSHNSPTMVYVNPLPRSCTMQLANPTQDSPIQQSLRERFSNRTKASYPLLGQRRRCVKLREFPKRLDAQWLFTPMRVFSRELSPFTSISTYSKRTKPNF